MARVLIIEDEAGILMVLREVLTDEGHEVITASDGLAGLACLNRIPLPGLIIVDLLMPRVTGKTFVETIRAEARLQDIPVVLITGSVPGTTGFPREGSYQAFISKPFDLRDIIATVHDLTTNPPRQQVCPVDPAEGSNFADRVAHNG